MTTPNKDLEQPAHGSEVNTWDSPLNDNFSKLDQAFGGSTVLNATGATGAVAFTLAQATPPTIIVSGLPIADVTYQLPSGVGGTWTVSNATTGGFAIKFQSLAGGSALEIPAGFNTLISCDGTSRGMVYSSEIDPTFRALELISTQTANGTSDVLQWTGLSGFTNYLLVVAGLRPVISSSSGILQFGTGGAPTWLTSGYYRGLIFLNLSVSTGAVITPIYNQNVTGIGITGVSSNSGPLGSGANICLLNMPSNNSLMTSLTMQMFADDTGGATPTDQLVFFPGGALNTSLVPKTAVRIQCAAGNWQDGGASLYGLRS